MTDRRMRAMAARRELPALDAPASLSGVRWDAPEAALARWSPDLRAAEADGEATLSIYDVIGSDWLSEGWTAKRVAGVLRAVGRKPVTVNVNSPGGDLFEGLAIYNTLREHPEPVTVNVVGIAASAASVIAMAGDTVRVAEAGFLMVHNAWGLVIGNRHELAKAAQDLEQFDGAMAALYARRTGIAEPEIAAMMDAETWMNGAQSVERGFADALLESDAIEATGGREAHALRAERVIEAALAASGTTRSERRRLVSELRGKPGATANATPGAGEEWAVMAAELTSILAA